LDGSVDAVEKRLAGRLQPRVFGIGGFARIAKRVPTGRAERRAPLMALIELAERKIHFEAALWIVVEARGRDFVLGRHPARRRQMRVGPEPRARVAVAIGYH